MPIQLHIQKMKREADVIKKNEKSANDYLTQTGKIRILEANKKGSIIVTNEKKYQQDVNDKKSQ